MTIERKDFNFEIKAVNDDGFFSGYASVFGNEDSYGDIVVKGAFADTLAEWQAKGRFPPCLWNHKTDEPIGIYTVMQEDEKGLYVEGRLLVNDVVRAKEVHALMKVKAVDGMSIGYSTIKRNVDANTGITELLELKLWENSIVTFPANDLSRIGAVKSALKDGKLPSLQDFEKFLREAGFSRKESTIITSRGLKSLLGEPLETETALKNALSILKGSQNGTNRTVSK